MTEKIGEGDYLTQVASEMTVEEAKAALIPKMCACMGPRPDVCSDLCRCELQAKAVEQRLAVCPLVDPTINEDPMQTVLTYAKQAQVFLLKALEVLDEHDKSEHGSLTFWANKTRFETAHFVKVMEAEVGK